LGGLFFLALLHHQLSARWVARAVFNLRSSRPGHVFCQKPLKRVGGEPEFDRLSARSTTLVGAIVAVLIIGAVASIGYYQFVVAPNITTTTTTTSSVGCTPSTCVNVTIPNNSGTCTPALACGYSPDTINVVLGKNNTVVWMNNDTSGAPHTVTPKSPTAGWEAGSGQLMLGDSFTYTFTTAGSYPYYCTIHPTAMAGTVVVKA
jgi:plastocyanin